MKRIVLVAVLAVIGCATKTSNNMGVVPERVPSSVKQSFTTTSAGTPIPDYIQIDNNGRYGSFEYDYKSSSRGRGDEGPARFREISFSTLKEICPGDSTLNVHIQDAGRKFVIQVTYNRSTHRAEKAVVGYTYEPTTSTLGFTYGSYPATAPTIPFNAQVIFDSSGLQGWDSITIVDQNQKTARLSRNDITKPISQGANLVLSVITRSNFEIYSSMCVHNGLL